MKFFQINIFMFLVGTFALADGKDNHFAERKQHDIQEMDLHLSALQAAKSCISSATDHEALKHCHEELEKSRRMIREENIESQIHRLEGEKSKLEKN